MSSDSRRSSASAIFSAASSGAIPRSWFLSSTPTGWPSVLTRYIQKLYISHQKHTSTSAKSGVHVTGGYNQNLQTAETFLSTETFEEGFERVFA